MKQHKVLTYKVILEEELDEQKKRTVFVSYVPRLGISDFGKTVEEALKNTKEAIRCHVEALKKLKEEIPQAESKTAFFGEISVSFS